MEWHNLSTTDIANRVETPPLRPSIKPKSLGDSDPYCVVKWGGVELGRTKTCPNTREPNWGDERFRLVLPAEEPNHKKEHLPLVLEVWDEDMPGTKGDFLGQVILNPTTVPGLGNITLSQWCR